MRDAWKNIFAQLYLCHRRPIQCVWIPAELHIVSAAVMCAVSYQKRAATLGRNERFQYKNNIPLLHKRA